MSTNKERQAAYRQKARSNNQYRINTFVSTEAGVALGCLSRHYAVTKREILEKLLVEAHKRVLAEITEQFPDDDIAQDKAFSEYFGCED